MQKNDYNKNITITILPLIRNLLINFGDCRGSWSYLDGINPIGNSEDLICDIPDKNNSEEHIWRPYPDE